MASMPELSHGRRMLVLAICCMSLLIVSLDNTVLNVALPALQREFHASTSGLQWAIDAYTLVLASLLMLAGSTADRIGRKRVFMAGLVVLLVGALTSGRWARRTAERTAGSLRSAEIARPAGTNA